MMLATRKHERGWETQAARPAREAQLRRALFRGEQLHMRDEQYRAVVSALIDPLLWSDAGDGDLTAEALGLAEGRASAQVLAKEPGVAAGLEEFTWLLTRGDIAVKPLKTDGAAIERGDVLAEMEGQRGSLLSCERTVLNLLQRMSGIATMTRRLQEQVQRRNPETFVVATRKTPWGLLDKRAVHLGGGGTHRLGLGEAILVKNNHLALLAAGEQEAVGPAIERAWAFRDQAAFIEIEVRGAESAVAAAQAFRRLREKDSSFQARPEVRAICPCLLLLDNMSPERVRGTLHALQAEGLRDEVLVEASGTITESNLEEYASCGADALSMGALTHSPRALDISLRIF
jgi:nicotinate-nucleotide pyrophosphorylase (carboxylating)